MSPFRACITLTLTLILFYFRARYVIELHKMRETFIEPLLHPYTTTSPITSPTPLDFEDYPRSDTPRESIEHLPIASRFLSPLGFSDQPSAKDDGHPNIDGESLNSAEEDEVDDRLGAAYYSRPRIGQPGSAAAKHNHPRSPYGSTVVRSGPKPKTSVPFPSRSHQSLPPPPRHNPMATSTQSLGRQSFIGDKDREREHNMLEHTTSRATTAGNSRVLRKFKKSNPSPAAGDVLIPGAVPPAQIPEDLRKCLEVIEGGILDGHMKLSEGLRKRYEEQYPLVRSLADVFVSNVRIFFSLLS